MSHWAAKIYQRYIITVQERENITCELEIRTDPLLQFVPLGCLLCQPPNAQVVTLYTNKLLLLLIDLFCSKMQENWAKGVKRGTIHKEIRGNGTLPCWLV